MKARNKNYLRNTIGALIIPRIEHFAIEIHLLFINI